MLRQVVARRLLVLSTGGSGRGGRSSSNIPLLRGGGPAVVIAPGREGPREVVVLPCEHGAAAVSMRGGVDCCCAKTLGLFAWFGRSVLR